MRRSVLTKAIILISFIALVWSCKKEPDLLGLDLIPEEELLNHDIIDTITVIAWSEEDTLMTKNTSSTLLGSIYDPVFGLTTASFYTEFFPAAYNQDFGNNTIVDSIFITIPYKGIYGDSNAIQTVRIYEMTEGIVDSAFYYNYSTLPVSSQLVGEATFVPDLKDSIYIDTVKIKPMLRIPLSAEFADKLTGNEDAYISDSSFQSNFKGLYFTVEDAASPGSGSIMYLNMTDEYSTIHMYYRYSTDTSGQDQDTAKLAFSFRTGHRFSNFEHFDYTEADPLFQQQLAGNPESGKEKLFLQAMAGTRIRLEFPYLDDLAGKNLAIHEAALIFEPADDANNIAPAYLKITELSPKTEVYSDDFLQKYPNLPYFANVSLEDEEEGATHILGNLNDDIYKFRITRYIQDRILHPEDPVLPMVIYISGATNAANSAVIKGTEAESGRFKLKLYLSPLN